MNSRRALCIAACLLPFTAATAWAQGLAPWPQAQQQAQPQQVPSCVVNFNKLRDDAAKKAGAIRAASERHASPQEACKLFNVFSAAEAKMVKYATDNGVWCGIPPQIVKQIKDAHAKTNQVRIRVCQAAANPPRPTGPSLSDALGAPITDSNNIRTGGGTFDTLTGAPLGKR